MIQLRLIVALAALLALLGGIAGAYLKGRSDGRALMADEWTRSVAREDARRAERSDSIAKQRAAAKVRVERLVIHTIERIPVYVPAATPDLPAGWRVLHDAAARGVPPGDPSGPDGTPVSAQDAARTVTENYGQYHDLADRLTRLQQLIREQGELTCRH